MHLKKEKKNPLHLTFGLHISLGFMMLIWTLTCIPILDVYSILKNNNKLYYILSTMKPFLELYLSFSSSASKLHKKFNIVHICTKIVLKEKLELALHHYEDYS
jgi:hypothetical protein